MIKFIKLTVIFVIVRLSRFFVTTGPEQGPGAAFLNLSVLKYSHEGFQEGIHDFQDVSKLLHTIFGHQ